MTKTTRGWQRALDDADLTVWLAEDVPLLFQEIPAGEFSMGSRGYQSDEEPRHLVRIMRPFYMSSFPVTQHQWRAVAARSAGDELDPNPSHFAGELHPVEQVSWHDTVQWCQVLQASGLLDNLHDRQGNLITNAETGLPSEAQWEYACRAGTETEYHTGEGEAALAEAGWHWSENAKESTQPVGQLQANDFKLYDMHGNVDEWCRDAYDEHAYKRRVNAVCDPEMLGDDSSFRVVRGGFWYYTPWICRAAYRSGGRPVVRSGGHGFRVCLFSGPCPVSQGAEPVSVGVARRDDAAKP